jgi:hypothetical protein
MKNIITIISLILLSLNVFGQANPNIDLSLSPSTVALNTNSILTATASNFGNGADIVGNSLRLTVQVGVNAEILGLAPGSSANWTLLSFTTGAGNQYQLKNVGSVLDFQQDEIKFIVKGIVVSGATLISGNITYLPGINTLLSPPAPNASQGNSTTVDDNALTALIVTAPAAPLVASATFLPINCNGGTTTITVSATGGTPPYSGTGAFSVFANTYVYTVTDANGATSATTAVVNQPASLVGSSNVIACNSATLVGYSGNPVTATGLYPVSYTNAAGCDSVHTYNVTINTGTFNATTATACNTYTWLANAVTYTTSGTYTYSYLNANGCASVDTLHLTINTGTFNATSATACNTYTWLANGVTYTASGNYTYSYMNANGCASVDTLHLTINSSTSNTTAQTACNSYTWPLNGTTYSASGTYSVTSTNAAGCTHVEILNLTINLSTSNTSGLTVCDTYTWPVNNVTYTASGSYSVTSVNAAGCTHTEILNLTVYNSTSSNTSITAVGSYLWPVTGITYTTGGTYTNIGSNTFGCPKYDTLVLTITPMLVVVSAKAMLAGPYVSATGLMRDDLRTKNLIPFAQPYGTAPYVAGFTHVGGGSETVSAAVLAVSGNDAIVDWVFVSLRSAANPATVVQTQAALIQRDGDIVSASDGVSPLTFTAIPGYYFVAVDHRNHLGIITADSFALSATNTALNLANGSTALHVNATNNNPAPLTGATKNFSGVRALYAGNCNIANVLLSKQVSYGPATTTDRAALFTATGGTATINAYTIFDVDMNGFARYNGLNPDRAVISNTVNNSNVIIAHEQQP